MGLSALLILTHMYTLIKGWLLASTNFGLLYLVSILIARWLGPEDFGTYSVAVAIVTILASAATMGLEKLGAEELPIYSKHLKWDLYRGFLKRTTQLILIVAIVVSILSIGMFELFELYYDRNIAHPSRWVISIFLPVMATVYFLVELMAVNNRYVASMFVYRFQFPLMNLLLLVLFYIYITEFTFTYALIAFGGAWLICLITSIVILFRSLPKEIWSQRPEYETWVWLKGSYPFFINTLLLTARNYSGIIVLDIFHDSESIVGRYSAIAQTSLFIIIFMTTSNRYFLPKISVAIDSKDYDEINSILRSRVKMLGIICLIFILIMVFFGKDILALFNKGFIAGYPALLVLTAGTAIEVFAGISTLILQYLDNAKYAMRSYIYILTVSLILAFLLAKPLEDLGMALAFTIPVSVFGLWRIRYLAKNYNIKVLW